MLSINKICTGFFLIPASIKEKNIHKCNIIKDNNQKTIFDIDLGERW